MLNESGVRAGADYVVAKTREIIERFGPRPPGSLGERHAQEFLRKELIPCMDETRIEGFIVSPKAFMGFPRVAATLMLIAVILYWVSPWAALPFSALGVAVVLLEFVLYKPALDLVFPKASSCNVVGVLRAKGPARRRLILSGHADAAYEWRYNLKSVWTLRLVIVPALGGVAAKCAMDAAAVACGANWAHGYGNVWGVLGLVQFVLAPIAVATWFFADFKVVAPGANDNLTGSLVAVAAARLLGRLDRTELVVLVTGCEEAGLRGAKAYVREHGAELLATETLFLGLETFGDVGHLAICERDMNGIVKHDGRACALLRRAGETCGLALPFESVYVGSTDATAFTQGGVPATTLAGMDPEPPRYYHTRLDNWDRMDAECIARALGVTVEAVRLFDAEGLAGKTPRSDRSDKSD